MKNELILLVDSHHGIYSPFWAYQSLSDEVKEQIDGQLGKDAIDILNVNIDLIYSTDFDLEDVFWAFDKLCEIDIKINNTVYNIMQFEDIWLVPSGYDTSVFY
jgi:hypothetical protein